MRTWIRSEGDSTLSSSRLTGSTSLVGNGHCAASTNHTDINCQVYTSSSVQCTTSDDPTDEVFSYSLEEERNHYSQSFYPGMNESDIGDDESCSALSLTTGLPHATTAAATTTTTAVTSTTQSSVTASTVSSVTGTHFLHAKPTYQPPLASVVKESVSETNTVKQVPAGVTTFAQMDVNNERSRSPDDSLIDSQSNNSSPFISSSTHTSAAAFPSSTDHGFPDEFFTALRDLFTVLDDSKRGSVRVADIEKRWVDDDSTVFSPKGLTDCLRKVSTVHGTVDFDRFCAAIKICLLKNQTLLVNNTSTCTRDSVQETRCHKQEADDEEEEEAEDKDDYERHAYLHPVNQQQVPSSPSEVPFVRDGSVNSNCTLPTASVPYHLTKVNSSQDNNRSHSSESSSTKIYANSSCIQHPASSLSHGQQQQKLSSVGEQLVPPNNCLIFSETGQSNGHPIVNSIHKSHCINNRETHATGQTLASTSFYNARFIGKSASNVHDQQQPQQQQHPHSPESMVNQYYPQRKASSSSSNVHANTRNHIISPCEVPLPPPNPVSLAAINRVTKVTTTTAPLLAKPPHAYSILRRIASESAASSSGSTSNGHHHATPSHTSATTLHSKSKMNHKNIHNPHNHQVNDATSPSPVNKCSTVPRNKDRKFRANNLIQMFKNFKLNSVIEKTMNGVGGGKHGADASSSSASSVSSSTHRTNGTSSESQQRSKKKDDDSTITSASQCTANDVSNHQVYSSTNNSSLHQQQVPLPAPPPPAAPSSHASSSVDFIEAYPLPHLASSNSDNSYIPHPPNVINTYGGIIPPVALDDVGEEDLPLHFQSSRTQMMRRKRDRRHTVSHGIDYNHIKKMQILQHEKDILLRGLQAVERAKDWYLKQMADVTDKIRSAGRSFAPVPSDSCQAANERLQFRANRIIAANAHLIALMDEANFPIHMNLAFKPLLVPHSTDPIINLNMHPSFAGATSSLSQSHSAQVNGGGGESMAHTSDKNNSHMSQVESEKATFLHMLHSNGSAASASRKGSTSDCPFV